MSAIQINPEHLGPAVRRAFLAEAIFHICTIPLVTHTRQYLSLFFLRPSDITPAVLFFARVFAGLILFGMTPALLYGVPNTAKAIASRRATYVMLAGTEVYLIPLLLVELSRGGTLKKGAVFSMGTTAGLMSLLVTPFLFRLYVLFVKPDMMGRLEEVKDKRA
jgi:hypothetical protein